MSNIDYLDVLQRIQKVISSCTEEERAILIKILEEISETGYSKTYESVWLADYKEIPVDKKTFLTSPTYLGNSNDCGAAIYPAWMDVMLELEATGNQYNEIVFTGATRTGKTSTAVSDAAYQLYRLMCLKDPQAFFGLKSVTRISFFFFNLTQTLAKGVAFKEFNSTLSVSPWFNLHGSFSSSESNPTYLPEGDLIEVTYGSDASHALGKATYCVTGDTEILTSEGFIKISELADSYACIGQYDDDCNLFFSHAKVEKTASTNEIYIVTLEDGSCIKGTYEHLIMLVDGSYRKLGELSDWDIVETCDIYPLEDHMFYQQIASGARVASVLRAVYRNPIDVYDVIDIRPHHNFIARSAHCFVLHNCVIFDEVNFASAGIKDVVKAKKRMKEKYDTLVARVTGTFVKHGEVFGKLYVISSKRGDSDFMEDYIRAQQAAHNPHMYVFDKPQWEVWPRSKYSSSATFKIALGGKHQRSFVVPDTQMDEASLADLLAQGYQLMDVPEDNKTRFLTDFDIALRDIAGVAVTGSFSFISDEFLNPCIGPRKNPFYTDVLTIGTQDNLEISDFFHIDEVPRELYRCPIYLHMDLSLNTDRAGLSGIGITSRVDKQTEGNSKTVSLPFFSHMFSVGIEAPRGDKIPYDKILRFILWLKGKGFRIKCASRDQYQSEYIGQLLENSGIDSPKISLDRTPDGYIAFRAVLLEQRIDMVSCPLLEEELVHLQRDSVTGKLDHPVGGSKDIADTLAGAVWKATTDNPGVNIDSRKVVSAVSSVNRTKVLTNSGPSNISDAFSNLYKNKGNNFRR